MRTTQKTDVTSLNHILSTQYRVIGAILLRDMRTRFGRTHFGYLISVGWPLSHLIVLTGINYYLQKVVPMGTNPTIYAGTGLLPYILCLYPSRFMTTAVIENRTLLLFPIVKSLDLIYARIVLTLTIAFNVVVAFLILVSLAGIDFYPPNPARAIGGVLATVYLGISFGVVNAVFACIIPGWIIISIIFMILMYFSSGAVMQIDRLPESLQQILAINPLMHSVDWVRSSYFEGYGENRLSEAYLLGYATFNLLVGLAAERLFRGRVLQG